MKSKFLVMAAASMILASCGGGGGRPTFGDNEYPVVTVGTQSSTTQTTYPATIKGVQDVQISPKVAGFITQINVKEGQTVSAGQVLFVIDNVTYQAQVRQAQAWSGSGRGFAVFCQGDVELLLREEPCSWCGRHTAI